MNQVHILPEETAHGLEFNYAVWAAQTTVTLANVPWNNDYRDVVRFSDTAALDDYVMNNSGPVITTTGVTYARPGQAIRLSIPFNRAYRYNYLRAFNPAQPGTNEGSRAFYYFISDVRHIATNTTEFVIQLDIWQTFGYGVTFGNCFIERGHVGIANENAFSNYGRDFLTIPEGLDVGGEYQIEKQWSKEIATARDVTPIGDNTIVTDFDVMVVTTVSLSAGPVIDYGTVDNPKFESAQGSLMENLPNGAEIYIFATSQFQKFLTAFSKMPWITQGIISITAIPTYSTYDIPIDHIAVGETAEGDGIYAEKVKPGQLKKVSHALAANWRDSIALGRYANLKKFLTYPYMVMELTTYSGTPVMIKPESWADPDATIMEVPHFAPPSPRLAFYPFRYNAGNAPVRSDEYGIFNDGAEFMDMATGISDFPQFSLVNNGYLSYMAGNAHSIAFQHTSADWSQQRALSGAALGYDQATAGIDMSKELNRIGVSATGQQATLANETAGFSALQGGANSVLGGIGKGAAGGVGAVSGAANAAAGYAIQSNSILQGANIGVGAANASNRAQTGNAAYVRDTNNSYANYAAKGDYQNTIAGINAKVQDARMIQPTTSGQMGGNAFNLTTYQWGYDLKLKMLQPAAMASIGEYWLRYGYQVNRFGRMPSSFKVMSKFTYWKLRESYITSSSCPETFKQALRGIFEKGVTVWSNPSDIGNIDIADNAPLTGVTL